MKSSRGKFVDYMFNMRPPASCSARKGINLRLLPDDVLDRGRGTASCEVSSDPSNSSILVAAHCCSLRPREIYRSSPPRPRNYWAHRSLHNLNLSRFPPRSRQVNNRRLDDAPSTARGLPVSLLARSHRDGVVGHLPRCPGSKEAGIRPSVPALRHDGSSTLGTTQSGPSWG